jgi:lipid A ethanolaminephosphotransferase
MTRFNHLPRPVVSPLQFNLGLTLVLLVFYNRPLWQLLQSLPGQTHLQGMLQSLVFGCIIGGLFFLLLTLVCRTFIRKPLAIFLLCSAAIAQTFALTYGTLFDKTMLQNAFETDLNESLGLLSRTLVINFLILGVLPSLLVVWIRISKESVKYNLIRSTSSLVMSLVLVSGMTAAFYKDVSSTLRNQHQIRNMIIPTSYLYYAGRVMAGAYEHHDDPLVAVGEDAKQSPVWQLPHKKFVTILVVGETARAANFSLNGYSRQTNPELSQAGVINFKDVASCGTSTAVSVPCLFSDLTRDEFDNQRAQARENLLDVVQRAGINVLWRDNNSGCKGVCERVTTQPKAEFSAQAWCQGDECFDETMLTNLDTFLEQIDQGGLIVLHQLGSHGPAYQARYPKQFAKFTPECSQADLSQCSQEAIVNTYDNSILYTDHFLAQVIKFLKAREDRYTTAMFYVSDHGESLGENNVYLHGLPYMLAPESQTHVPMMAWLSDDYQHEFNVDAGCLARKQSTALSHDNIFHSMLGLLAINTSAYQADKDIFATCHQNQRLSRR